jgi:ribonuclease BN (tRNA processing enzyme)
MPKPVVFTSNIGKRGGAPQKRGEVPSVGREPDRSGGQDGYPKDPTCSVLSNSIELHRILMNLCTNAILAIGEKTGIVELDVTTREVAGSQKAEFPDLNPGTFLRISVSDNGHGIPSEVLESIFDPLLEGSMTDVVVQLLGTGDSFGSGARDQTCIYVDCPDFRFLIDIGASGLISMKRWGVSPAAVDAILLTHLHGDHFGGIPFFILDAQLVSKRTKPLVIAGPPGLERRIHAAMEIFFPGSSKIRQKFAVRFVEIGNETPTAIGPLSVDACHVLHASGDPSLAIRVACCGKTIAYSGDTEWTDALVQAAQGADLFICEAYFFEKKIKFHLDYATLMRHRPELGCRRLVVTHMGEDMLSRIQHLEAETAEDGKRIVL